MRIILYRAIIITFLKYDNFDEVYNFINEYVPKLPPEHRENMLNFSFALLYFSVGDYEKSLGYGSKINFELFVFRYDIRILLFKVYYELNFFEEAFSLLDTHRHFIKNNKTVSDYYREMHSNFIHYYNDLLKVKLGTAKFGPGLLKKNVSLVNNIYEKSWFISKANELDNSNR
jgi:hypothetical protein